MTDKTKNNPKSHNATDYVISTSPRIPNALFAVPKSGNGEEVLSQKVGDFPLSTIKPGESLRTSIIFFPPSTCLTSLASGDWLLVQATGITEGRGCSISWAIFQRSATSWFMSFPSVSTSKAATGANISGWGRSWEGTWEQEYVLSQQYFAT